MLTKAEKEAVQNNWAQATKDKGALGHLIFLTLFKMYPEYQDMFRDFKGLSEEQLKKSVRLKAHGLRVVNTLDGAIASLDDMEVCAESLYYIGASHKPHGVKAKHFEHVNVVIDKLFTEKLGQAYLDNKAAWDKLLTGIVPAIQRGLD